MVEGVPAKCAQLLSDATVDVALVPIIEYQRIPDISLVPGVCVGSKREVRSVVLVSTEHELEAIRSVALDQSSRTSAALVKIIFREFLDREPRWTTNAPELDEMLRENDAALIIGDPAMTFHHGDLRIWDMASLWTKFTDLGFIFAMWMVRNASKEIVSRAEFAKARDEGLENRASIVAEYRCRIPWSDEQLDSYLTDAITFAPDDSMLTGLQLYFQLAHKHQLIEQLKPLSFGSDS